METYLSSIYVCILTHIYCILMWNVFLTVDQGQIFLKTTSLEKTIFKVPNQRLMSQWFWVWKKQDRNWLGTVSCSPQDSGKHRLLRPQPDPWQWYMRSLWADASWGEPWITRETWLLGCWGLLAAPFTFPRETTGPLSGTSGFCSPPALWYSSPRTFFLTSLLAHTTLAAEL